LNTEAVDRLITTLENDVSALGWDQPHRLYAIAGSLEDPRFDLMLPPFRQHPIQKFLKGYDTGLRVKPDVVGLALCNEGWRMRMPAELTEEQVPVLATFRKAGRQKGIKDEDIENALSRYFVELASELGISNAPDHLKVETRTVTAVLKDGTVVAGNRDRDAQLQIAHSTIAGSEVFNPKNVFTGRIPDALYAMLHWRRPSED
jgi:hypothetical protein